jgi:hypothetical protein
MTLNRQDQNTISPQYIIVKTLSTENKEGILIASRENYQVRSIIIVDFSTETLKERRARREVFQVLK